MFLTPPTIEELQNLDLSTLIEMLVEVTMAYTKLIESEGCSYKTNACKQQIINIQAAIKVKHDLENNYQTLSSFYDSSSFFPCREGIGYYLAGTFSHFHI